jgi:hypothetical protein
MFWCLMFHSLKKMSSSAISDSDASLSMTEDSSQGDFSNSTTRSKTKSSGLSWFAWITPSFLKINLGNSDSEGDNANSSSTTVSLGDYSASDEATATAAGLTSSLTPVIVAQYKFNEYYSRNCGRLSQRRFKIDQFVRRINLRRRKYRAALKKKSPPQKSTSQILKKKRTQQIHRRLCSLQTCSSLPVLRNTSLPGGDPSDGGSSSSGSSCSSWSSSSSLTATSHVYPMIRTGGDDCDPSVRTGDSTLGTYNHDLQYNLPHYESALG